MKKIYLFNNPNFYQYLNEITFNYQILKDQTNLSFTDSNINNELYLMIEEDNQEISDLINLLSDLYDAKVLLESRDVTYLLNNLMKKQVSINDLKAFYLKNDIVLKTYNNKPIYAKTLTQFKYLQAIMNNQITFGIGAAGSGKTFLAVSLAVKMLKNGNIKKIIITRPAVEAGEKLGFLPGDMKEKVDPYLIPIYDSLELILGIENLNKYLEKNIIEIAPLAYMRGRTLDDAVIILDEAQNTTSNQMKMFLTRIGFNSKMIVTGDDSQIDLPKPVMSGLVEAKEILNDINGIAVIRFTEDDVMRNPIVKQIIKAYER